MALTMSCKSVVHALSDKVSCIVGRSVHGRLRALVHQVFHDRGICYNDDGSRTHFELYQQSAPEAHFQVNVHTE